MNKKDESRQIPLNEEMSAITDSVDKDEIEKAQLAYQAAETKALEEAEEVKETKEIKEAEEESIPSRYFLGLLAFMAVVAIVIVAFAINYSYDKAENDSAVSGTWQMSASDYGQNRWFSDGVQEIKDAKTDAEAADAAQAWLEKVKLDPALLAGAAVYFLDEKVDSSTLVKDGWATKDAVELYSRLAVAIGMARVEVSEAPTTGYNSGVNDGQVVSAENSGISGDRKAVLVVLEDGTKVWLLARCGNAVKPNKPNIPTGPTDEKSSDPADYKQPGDDDTTDSGEGTKPPVTVTTPAESKPPVVVTDNDKPGTDPGTVAPGATEPDPSRPTPDPEPGTGGGEPNEGDPGLPAGF
jgi:hypothetical protein